MPLGAKFLGENKDQNRLNEEGAWGLNSVATCALPKKSNARPARVGIFFPQVLRNTKKFQK